DYPIGYVRWTETRNMEAFLQLLTERKVQTEPLISHRFPVEQADRAYELISGRTKDPFLGVMITYPPDAEQNAVEVLSCRPTTALHAVKVSAGLLGAGDFAMSTLLPAMRQVEGIEFVGACAANGAHSRHAAAKFGFHYCATDQDRILADPTINTV